MIDKNFLDMAHFPYLGEEPFTEVKEYEVQVRENGGGIRATNCRFFQPSNVESQVPQRLPFEMADEFHQPCDQLSIAYRRWLKELEFSYGTSLADGR